MPTAYFHVGCGAGAPWMPLACRLCCRLSARPPRAAVVPPLDCPACCACLLSSCAQGSHQNAWSLAAGLLPVDCLGAGAAVPSPPTARAPCPLPSPTDAGVPERGARAARLHGPPATLPALLCHISSGGEAQGVSAQRLGGPSLLPEHLCLHALPCTARVGCLPCCCPPRTVPLTSLPVPPLSRVAAGRRG